MRLRLRVDLLDVALLVRALEGERDRAAPLPP